MIELGARLLPSAFAKRGFEHGEESDVFRAPEGAFELNEAVEFQHADGDARYFEFIDEVEQVLVDDVVVDGSENVERSGVRHGELVTFRAEMSLLEAKAARVVSRDCVELVQRGLQASDVAVLDAINDVHVLREDGCALKGRRDPANHDELDLVGAEYGQQASEIEHATSARAVPGDVHWRGRS